jgi:predicted HicB family RNase H-like nuclease
MNDVLKYKEYYGDINYSAFDEVFHGKIIGISDLVTFEGSSIKELKKAFKDSVDDYLDFCKELGKEPEKSYKGSFNIRISPELHRQAAKYAAVNNMSLNEFVKYAIDKMVSRPTGLKKVKLS